MLLVFLVVVVVVVVVVKEYREGSHIFSSSSSSSVRFHSSSSSWKNTEKGLGYQSFGFKKKKREIFLSFFLSKNERKTRSCCPKDDRLNTRRVARRLETFAKETFFFFPQVKGRALYLFSKKKKKKKKKKRHIFVRREEV